MLPRDVLEQLDVGEVCELLHITPDDILDRFSDVVDAWELRELQEHGHEWDAEALRDIEEEGC